MIISLAAGLSIDNDLQANLDTMEKFLEAGKAENSDLVLFG